MESICRGQWFNFLPHNPYFYRPYKRSLLKLLWDKEKMLVTSTMFSICCKTNFNFSITFILPSTNAFNLDQYKNLVFGEVLRITVKHDCFKTGFSGQWSVFISSRTWSMSFNFTNEQFHRFLDRWFLIWTPSLKMFFFSSFFNLDWNLHAQMIKWDGRFQQNGEIACFLLF